MALRWKLLQVSLEGIFYRHAAHAELFRIFRLFFQNGQPTSKALWSLNIYFKRICRLVRKTNKQKTHFVNILNKQFTIQQFIKFPPTRQNLYFLLCTAKSGVWNVKYQLRSKIVLDRMITLFSSLSKLSSMRLLARNPSNTAWNTVYKTLQK